MKGKIRWVKPADIDRLLEIELAVSSEPLNEQQLRQWLSRDGNVCLVHYDRSTKAVEGFIRYRVLPRYFEVEVVAVHPACQGRGIGKALIEDAFRRLTQAHGNRLCFNVSDKLTAAHLWLQKLGFEAIGVVPGTNEGPDLYRFVKRLVPAPALITQETAN